jgi:hypothetical protein
MTLLDNRPTPMPTWLRLLGGCLPTNTDAPTPDNQDSESPTTPSTEKS